MLKQSILLLAIGLFMVSCDTLSGFRFSLDTDVEAVVLAKNYGKNGEWVAIPPIRVAESRGRYRQEFGRLGITPTPYRVRLILAGKESRWAFQTVEKRHMLVCECATFMIPLLFKSGDWGAEVNEGPWNLDYVHIAFSSSQVDSFLKHDCFGDEEP